MLFASLALERMPLTWSQFPDALAGWLQNAGGISAFGIVLVLLARALQRDAAELHVWALPHERLQTLFPIFKICIIGSAIGYGVLVLVWIADRMRIPNLARFLPRAGDRDPTTYGDWILALSGLLALFVVASPLVLDLFTRISWRRVGAMARLSWKEAIRGRVVWVFGAMALVFLFADWFLPAGAKPEDQLKTYVRLVYWSMTPLFLLTAALLGSFSIPNDVKSNSIHTIVTKPVEKFEIVLGRFAGYAALLTIGLLVMSGVSLIYVVRGVNEEAAHESKKARVPLYGKLRFVGTKSESEGENVGREWTTRSYITGRTLHQRDALQQFAVWDFVDVPANMWKDRDKIVFEFAFDVFRLSKGDEEGTGVSCSFTFVRIGKDMSTDPNRQGQELENKTDQMVKERDKERAAAAKKAGSANTTDPKIDEEIDRQLIVKYRMVQVPSIDVTDYHTQVISISAQDFETLMDDGDTSPRDAVRPALRVFVSVDVARQAQMVGVAKNDFYMLPLERPFWQNFLKGVLGMWCTYMLLLAVAISCSTYLSGVISLLLTLILYIAGLNVAFLREIAGGNVQGGGGPMESLVRLSSKMGPVGELDQTPTTSLVRYADNAFSWWISRILNIIPELERHDLHQYVAHGFDIGWFDVILLDNLLPLAGYLTPWAMLAYYLMKYREIANPQ